MSALNITYLKDYTPPAFSVEHHDLSFDLQQDKVVVTHEQHIKKVDPSCNTLLLNGEGLELLHIAMDGRALLADEYRYENDILSITNVGAQFVLTTQVALNPDSNLELSGLYRSNGIYCTQCEAQGFRRISFALDRPDVLSTYTVRIEGDKHDNPVMLSNGNLKEHGEVGENRYYTIWEDPIPKPCYLFALVAGKLAHITRNITTVKGKKIELRIYTEEAFITQIDFAMQALVDSIVWDEKRFHLSYDLNRFNVVAISDFNMGAMENKSLNIFNTKYVLADIHSATDMDFLGVQSVIGHEYFHNWTGNRITCRNWFQLSLKEGLTVFRDQEFSSDMNEKDLERIRSVEVLRRHQFSEDKGPMRHPVQPQEYAAIDNFYTATVYEKGAEIIRMMHTIIGEEKFQEGMKLYTSRYDGQAVRIEEFAQCMQDASGFAFSGQFFDWYTTAGTPSLFFSSSFEKGVFRLSVRQDVQSLEPKRPLLIPIRLALLSPKGELYHFADGRAETLLLLEGEEASWEFSTAYSHWIPVLMMGFSAPVYYHYEYTKEALATIALYAPDGFARYEAVQMAYRNLFLHAMQDAQTLKEAIVPLVAMIQSVLDHSQFSAAEKALLLAYPELDTLLSYLKAPINMDRAMEIYDRISRILALKMRRSWLAYLQNDRQATEPVYSVKDAGIRALRGLALKSVGIFEEEVLRSDCLKRYKEASCMTERMNALNALNLRDDNYRKTALDDFYQRFIAAPLVIDKWFALQGKDSAPDALKRMRQLAHHEAFVVTNPNRFRSLIGALMQLNPMVFHDSSGDGYRFALEQIRRIVTLNPQLASRMLGGFASVSQMDTQRKHIVFSLLDSLKLEQGLSTDVLEVIERLQKGMSECTTV